MHVLGLKDKALKALLACFSRNVVWEAIHDRSNKLLFAFADGVSLRLGSSLETDMRTLDDIWQEQQVLLPRLTLNTAAPSRTTHRIVEKIRDQRRIAVFNADPQAAAGAIQASCCR